MSSYDAIVPVSWSRLTEFVLPAWALLIEHQVTADAFAQELGLPRYADWNPAGGNPDDWDVDWATEWSHAKRHVPTGYLAELAWEPAAAFVLADTMRRSPLHAAFGAAPGGQLDTGSHLLWRAIRAAACEELPGRDAFCDTETYYGRLHAAPHCQAAGSKNGYRFVETVFSTTWVRSQDVYRHVALPSADPVLVELIQGLCLATRAFPATWVLREGNAWPACDDLFIQGILAPREVQQLASKLELLADLVRERNATLEAGRQDTLFPLFADRVTRSADRGLALLTVQSGL